MARVLVLIEKAIKAEAFEEAQSFYDDLVDGLNNDEEWGSIGSTIVEYHLNPIGKYLDERPKQNVVD